MADYEQHFPESADDSPETVSVEDVKRLILAAATDIEIQARLEKHNIQVEPLPDPSDPIAVLEYENDMLGKLVEAKQRDAQADLLAELLGRLRELKRTS